MDDIITDVLIEKLSPFLSILFGSTVKGNVRQSSDIDITYLSDDKVSDQYEIFLIAQELASKLQRDVDLIDLSQASTVFQAQVVSTGKVIYCTDEHKRAQFEMKILKMYTKLNEERSHIKRRIRYSG